MNAASPIVRAEITRIGDWLAQRRITAYGPASRARLEDLRMMDYGSRAGVSIVVERGRVAQLVYAIGVALIAFAEARTTRIEIDGGKR